MRQIKIAAPGYILMPEMEKDMPATLKKIGAMGYDGFEFLGFYGHSAGDIRLMCQDAGVTPFAAFIKLTDLTGETTALPREALSAFDGATWMPGATKEAKMEYLCELGCEYVGLLTPIEIMNDVMLGQLTDAARLCRRFGLKAQFHNHNYEYLIRHGDGYRMDHIMASTPKELLFEPDLGWMEIGGARCPDQLRRYAHRIEVIHLKDYDRAAFDPDLPYTNKPTGYGVMDWDTLLPLCESLIAPNWYTADHDCAYDNDVFEELGMSHDFIRTKLNSVNK